MFRVLIVDDDDAFRRMLATKLRRAGYEVDTAENGKIAIERFSAKQSDVVLTDLVMPEKEGIETIIELRKKYPALKIIAMSGGGREGPTTYLHVAEALGAFGTLEKPFSQDRVLEMLSRALCPAA